MTVRQRIKHIKRREPVWKTVDLDAIQQRRTAIGFEDDRLVQELRANILAS